MSLSTRTVNVHDALLLLVNIVKAFGPDHSATDPTGVATNDGGCTYFSHNKPSPFTPGVFTGVDYDNLVPVCIVGQVFSRLGILRALVRPGGDTQYSTCDVTSAMWDNAAQMGVTFTEDARALLRAVQMRQDTNSTPWGQALTAAVKATQEEAVATFKANSPLFSYTVDSHLASIPVTNPDTVATNSQVVRDFMRENRRINAIKEVRATTGCGLKEAKEAVERAYPLGVDHSNA